MSDATHLLVSSRLPHSSLFSLPLAGGPSLFSSSTLGCHNTRLPRPRELKPIHSLFPFFPSLLFPPSSLLFLPPATNIFSSFASTNKTDDRSSILFSFFLNQNNIFTKYSKCPTRDTTTRALPSTTARRPSRVATPNTLLRLTAVNHKATTRPRAACSTSRRRRPRSRAAVTAVSRPAWAPRCAAVSATSPWTAVSTAASCAKRTNYHRR